MKVTADEHIHDSKSVPELVENIIKSDEMTTTTIGKLFGDEVLYESNDVLDICPQIMESCTALK
jgi:hypothetical protein